MRVNSVQMVAEVVGILESSWNKRKQTDRNSGIVAFKQREKGV